MRIAIIGGGIVGSTAAFYLSHSGHTVTLFDDDTQQATKAAAGIICPWLSQRRNKQWYTLTSMGASFYKQLIDDLQNVSIDTSFYRQSGTYVFRNNPDALKKLETIAHQRQLEGATIGDIIYMSAEAISQKHPEIQTEQDALFVSGGAVIDGSDCTRALKQAASQKQFTYQNERVTDLRPLLTQYDKIILATGAWLNDLIQPLGYTADVRGQKGQLFETTLSNKRTAEYPVFMPQGEIDLLPFPNGKWVIGATHENDKGFDGSIDLTLLESMKNDATLFLPTLKDATIEQTRVGTRAYTSDFTPFFGEMPDYPNILVASGLGSSGLTSGPLIGYLLHLMINAGRLPLDVTAFHPINYIQKS